MSQSDDDLPDPAAMLRPRREAAMRREPINPRFSLEAILAEQLSTKDQRQRAEETQRRMNDLLAAGGVEASVRQLSEEAGRPDHLEEGERAILEKFSTSTSDFPEEPPGEAVLRHARAPPPPPSPVNLDAGDAEESPLADAVVALSSNPDYITELIYNPLVESFFLVSCAAARPLRTVFRCMTTTPTNHEAWQCRKLLSGHLRQHRATPVHHPGCAFTVSTQDVLSALDHLGIPRQAVCVDALSPPPPDHSPPASPPLFALQQLILFLTDYAQAPGFLREEFVTTIVFALCRIALDPLTASLSVELGACVAALLAAPSDVQWPGVARTLIATLPRLSTRARNLAMAADVIASSKRGRQLQATLALAMLLSVTPNPVLTPGDFSQVLLHWLRMRHVTARTSYEQLYGQLQLLDLAIPYDGMEMSPAGLHALRDAVRVLSGSIRAGPETKDRCKCKLLLQHVICKLDLRAKNRTTTTTSTSITDFFGAAQRKDAELLDE